MVDPEKFFQKYDAMKEEYESMKRKCADLITTHTATLSKFEISQV